MLVLNFSSLEKRATTKRQSLVNFELLNWVLRSEIFLHKDYHLCVVLVILGFAPISNRFQKSKHVIKARDSHLTLVDIAIEGFISKPPFEGTQIVKLPTFSNPNPVEPSVPEHHQPITEEIISSDEEKKADSEDTISEEDTEKPVQDEDFEVFYHTCASEEEELNP